MNLCINHLLINLDANTDDIKLLINQKRPERKNHKPSTCNLWLRLKTIEQMGPFSLVTFLRTNQLHRPEINSSQLNNDPINTEKLLLTNPRRSRLIHFHICTTSDEFNFDINSYVGLLIFSYDNQSKFILNGHHAQRGDIIIKQIKFLSPAQNINRGLYDALFKWYFGRLIDQRFFGVGFLCSNGKWRSDLITFDDRELYRYEHHIFDMFILTHWLTTPYTTAKDAQEMELNAKDLLLKQYDIVKKKLIHQENEDLLKNWEEFIGSGVNDLKIAIEQFSQTIEKEIESIFKETNSFFSIINTI